jgi:hypothetical protein
VLACGTDHAATLALGHSSNLDPSPRPRVPLVVGGSDRSAVTFCETRRMVRTDDEQRLVVDGQRWRHTDPALSADALDDSRRRDQER